VQPILSSTLATTCRWILPIVLLTSCSLSSGKPSGEVDADREAVLGVVIERMNAEGDSVRLLQRVFCPSMETCQPPEDSGLDQAPELESVGLSLGVTLAFARSVEDLPLCNWPDAGGESGGFLVWFAEPQIVGDSAVVRTERACAGSSRRSVYAQADSFELVREGPGWRIVRVARLWET
jgi:hypothetical protein